MGSKNYVLDKILNIQMSDKNGNVITEFEGFNDKPIKLIYEGDLKFESNGDYDVTITRKLTLSEIAELFGVDEVEILDDKIGILTLDEYEEN